MRFSIAFKVAHAKGREAVRNREYAEGEVQLMTVEEESRNLAEAKAEEILMLRYVATSDDADDYVPEILEVRELEGPVRDILTGKLVRPVHSYTTCEHGFGYEIQEDGEQLVMTIRCPGAGGTERRQRSRMRTADTSRSAWMTTGSASWTAST